MFSLGSFNVLKLQCLVFNVPGFLWYILPQHFVKWVCKFCNLEFLMKNYYYLANSGTLSHKIQSQNFGKQNSEWCGSWWLFSKKAWKMTNNIILISWEFHRYLITFNVNYITECFRAGLPKHFDKQDPNWCNLLATLSQYPVSS